MRLPAILLALLLAACVSDGRNLQPGVADASAVRSEMGQPAEVLKAVHGGEIWFYPRGRTGRQTFRVELAPDGRLVNVEQVLYEKNFDRIIDGKTTREQLRQLLGPPSQEWLAMNGWETIWDYHYWWASQQWVVHFGIDQKGVVTGQHRRSEINDPSNRL